MKGALRALLRRLGLSGSSLERFSRMITRGNWRVLANVAKGTFLAAMVIEAGISMSCGFTCGNKTNI